MGIKSRKGTAIVPCPFLLNYLFTDGRRMSLRQGRNETHTIRDYSRPFAWQTGLAGILLPGKYQVQDNTYDTGQSNTFDG